MGDFTFSDTDQALWLSHFDAKGVFIGSGITIIPKNTGLPANTTMVKCDPQGGFTGIWNGSEWHYVLDNRGSRYWNQYGVGTVVVNIDDVIPEWAIFVEPPKKEPGFVLLFTDGEWLNIKDKTGSKYYDSLGNENIVSSPYFEIPEGFTFLAPPEPKSGFATQWNGDEWVYIEDNRGLTVYDKKNRGSSVIDYIGPIKEGYTRSAPGSNFDEWDGSKWVVNADELKKHQVSTASNQKKLLIVEADSEIAALQNAVKYGMAIEGEVESLEAWEVYRIELMRIIPENAPDLTWPVKP